MKPLINWSQFEAVQMEIGRIVLVELFPEAIKPAYRIAVDFGPERGILRTSAQITQRYRPEDLLGRQIVGVTNFPPKQIGPFISEFLLLGALDPQGTAILEIESEVPPGTPVA